MVSSYKVSAVTTKWLGGQVKLTNKKKINVMEFKFLYILKLLVCITVIWKNTKKIY